MDCQTFDSSLLDALYDELDTGASTAMDEHATGCAACASRIARLRKTRDLVSPALELPLPDGLEARILAAAESAMDAKAPAAARAPDAASGDVIPLADRKKRGGIVALLSRPQLAVAATFVLVLGAAVLLQTAGTVKREAAPAAVAERAPAAEEAREPSAPGAQATAVASALAYATPPPPAPVAAPTAAAPMAAKAGGGGAALGRAESKPSERRRDPAFDAAKALFDAGRYAEALPRFQALAATTPEAELYVARCIANTSGCGAALAHYDRAASSNAGSESGSRAALEAARCSSRAGQPSAARSRLQRLTNDDYVAGEAQAELAALDAPAPNVPAVKAAKPAATATSRPSVPANVEDDARR